MLKMLTIMKEEIISYIICIIESKEFKHSKITEYSGVLGKGLKCIKVKYKYNLKICLMIIIIVPISKFVLQTIHFLTSKQYN
jgi:hypothetical protein